MMITGGEDCRFAECSGWSGGQDEEMLLILFIFYQR